LPNGAANGPTNGAARKSSNSAAKKLSNGAATAAAVAINSSMNGNAKVLTQDLKANSSTGMVISSARAKTKLVQAPIDVSISKDSVRVLPSDEGFSWSKESYSATQRQIDIWSFVLALRAQIWLLDAKWTYIGGFTEDKQVSTVLDFHWMSNSFSLEKCFPLMFCIRFSVTAEP